MKAEVTVKIWLCAFGISACKSEMFHVVAFSKGIEDQILGAEVQSIIGV